jgi:DNA invertase Pin-like site-specific DNA recombinase
MGGLAHGSFTSSDRAAMSRTFVAYLRVSTDRQGRSGLGLEAQQAAIASFLKADDKLLLPPFTEVESGKNSDRPQLRLAMDRCRKTGATLLIARLDRLARNVRFISALMEEGVPFVACDMPNATPFMLHVYAAVAEEEARAISRRTKAALAAAKARGVKLGGDRGYRPVAAPDARLGGDAVRRDADHAAHRAMVAIEAIRVAHGPDISLHAVARGLTERQVATPRGGAWTATAVRRVLARTVGQEDIQVLDEGRAPRLSGRIPR